MENVEEVAVIEVTEENTPSCANCGSTQLAAHYKTPLCQPCRERYIKYPVPLWIKVFGGALLAVLAFCLFNLPKNLQTGMLYRKGKLAAEKHQYQTAAKAFRGVLEKEPNYVDAQCQLLIASFYNGDIATVAGMYTLLENKEIEDKALFSKVSQLLSNTERYLPSDSFNHFIEASGIAADSIPAIDYYSYLANHPDDDYAKVKLASILIDQHAYAGADSLLSQTLRFDPYYLLALTLKMPLKRELLQYDSAMHYANQLLAINQEYTYAHGSKVRILLHQKKDKEALQMAQQLNNTYKDDGYILASLALAYHFNNDTKQRDLILQQAAKDTSNVSLLSYVNNVISGKEKFRTN